MQIGPHRIDPPLILAPMAGVTDKPFRTLCRRLGAGYAVSEMTASDPRLRHTSKSLRRLDHAGETAPVGVQIAGSDPDLLAAAARHAVAGGAQIIDINMGCPAKKVCGAAAGSALLRDESLVARILAAVVAAVDVPTTLKIRTGWDASHRNALTIARIAEDAGIAALAVHGRTRDMHYTGAAEHDTVAAIKHSVAIPVIANGDIADPVRAAEVLRQTHADAIMIGRAAQGRPWIFRDIAAYLDTGCVPCEPEPDEVGRLLLEHVAALHGFYGAHMGVRVARKHLGWYARGRVGERAFRERVFAAETPARQIALTREYFAGLAADAELAA